MRAKVYGILLCAISITLAACDQQKTASQTVVAMN